MTGSHVESSHGQHQTLTSCIQTACIASVRFSSKTMSLQADSDSNWFNLTQTLSFSLNLMIAAIFKSGIFNSTILDSGILVFLSNSLTLAKIGSHPLHKKNFTGTSLPNLEFGAHQGSAQPPHPTNLPPCRSLRVISPLSHFGGTTLSVAD